MGGVSLLFLLLVMNACDAPITLTSWKNPQVNGQISKVVVMPLFEKLEFIKPFESAMVSSFTKKGLKSIGSLGFLNPTVKYPINDIKHRCDSMGADGILVFIYEGTDKTESYIPPTTYYTGGYGGYGGYWGGGYWGGGYYGGYYGGGVVTTGGYWTSTTTVKLQAKLYVKGSPEPIWTAEVSVTDPTHVDESAYSLANSIFYDWEKNGLLKITKTK